MKRHACSLTIKLSGGLGNQLFQLALAIRLSIEHERPFILEDSAYRFDPLRQYELSVFGIEPNVSYSSVIDRNGLSISAQEIACNCASTEIVEKTFYFSPIEIPKKRAQLHGYWQSPKYFEAIADVLRLYIMKTLDSLNAEGNQSVAHFRLGDMYSNREVNAKHGTLPIQYYLQAMSLLGQGTRRVLCLSDNPELLKGLYLNLLSSKFTDTEFVIPRTENHLQDLALIAKSKKCIVANSTFSWWGAFLANNNFTIAPRNHFSDLWLREYNICDYFPKSWILV